MNIVVAQPAHKLYAFDRGWRIMRYVMKPLFQRINVAARWWFHKAEEAKAFGGSRNMLIRCCIYVCIVGLVLAGGIQCACAMILVGLFLLIQSIMLSIWVVLCLIMIGILALCTFVYSRFYRIFFRCTDCHKQMNIPTFICFKCAAEHTRLWPSIYGILAHRCICEAKLPTLRMSIPGTKLMKRDDLVRICPECRVQLNASIGQSTNIHIPIVGGPSTGKSNLIVMATKEFKETYESTYHYVITFPDSKHELDYTENVKRLATGRALAKTTEIAARAYNLMIQPPRTLVPKLAYIYDAAGEAYNTSDNTKLQEYYKYINGILFVIDPFSIGGYRAIHRDEIAQIQNLIRPSELDVMQAYERMFDMFEDSAGLHKGRRFPHPIAIVLTKVDALNLEYEIGSEAAHQLMASDPSMTQERDAINALVRNFLCEYGLDHFVRDVEMQFSNVRYFSCSALGRMPDNHDGRSFEPIRVLDALVWLLASAKAISVTPDGGKKTRVLTQWLPMQQQTK